MTVEMPQAMSGTVVIRGSEWARGKRPDKVGEPYATWLAGEKIPHMEPLHTNFLVSAAGAPIVPPETPGELPRICCCIGLLGRACGIDDLQMWGKGEPSEILEYDEGFEEVDDDELTYLSGTDGDKPGPHHMWFHHLDNDFVSLAIGINDDKPRGGEPTEVLSDDDKIEALRPLFREIGWEIDWRPDE